MRHRGGGHKSHVPADRFHAHTRTACPRKSRRSSTIPTARRGIALLHYRDGEKRYILAPLGLAVGDVVVSGPAADIKTGNALPLSNIPVGHGHPQHRDVAAAKAASSCAAAGGAAQLMAKEGDYAQVRMPSGEVRKVAVVVPRDDRPARQHRSRESSRSAKPAARAGSGRRPHVRGIAMNPVDHPHGGGEARSTAGRPPTTPWGEMTMGKKTRRNKRTDKFIVKRRSKK